MTDSEGKKKMVGGKKKYSYRIADQFSRGKLPETEGTGQKAQSCVGIGQTSN